MRWNGQKIETEDPDALPGLRAGNLVRSVSSPDFAGVVFHEVLAKSALNHVPAASALPFGWTINPYRGCTHACTFCLDPATLVLRADGRTVPLDSLRVGDEVYGTVLDGRYRRYVPTRITAVRWTRRSAHRVTLADGTELIASDDHRFLTDRGWKHVTGAMSGAHRRPFLTGGNSLMGFGLGGSAWAPRMRGVEYQRGYLTGMLRGDGSIFHGTYDDGVRSRTIHRFRLALTDVDAVLRARAFLGEAGIETDLRRFTSATERHRAATAIQTAVADRIARIERLIEWPSGEPSREWRAGFLGGIFDAEGSCSRGVLRISNTDPELLGRIREALDRFDVPHADDVAEGRASQVRLTGGLTQRQRFFRIARPAITRKLSLEGSAVKSSADLRVVSVEALGFEAEMIDITTGTGDFIANGVISHNCFARDTHTYLDLDAGHDFDSQIVVKVNVAEVLEREVARPSWGRHPVALGTNTDPYQRAEGRYRLMPGIIAALAAHGTPISILTKGTLLRRDLPLLVAAAEQVPVDLAMTIAIHDAELQKSVEPGAPSTAARLATIAAAREAGFAPAVFLMPVLPDLTDSRAHLDAALGAIAEAGGASIAWSALHLRPGAREWFFAWLESTHPDLVPRYRRLYRGSAYAPKEYRAWLAGRIRPLVRKHGLDRARTEPATGAIRSRLIGDEGRAEAVGVGARTGVGLLAAELSPAAASAIQPTLF